MFVTYSLNFYLMRQCVSLLFYVCYPVKCHLSVGFFLQGEMVAQKKVIIRRKNVTLFPIYRNGSNTCIPSDTKCT